MVGFWFGLILLCFVGRAGILLLFMGSVDPPKGVWIWDQSGNHYDSLLTSSKHFKRYFGLRKDLGMEEERSTSLLPKCYADLRDVNRGELPRGREAWELNWSQEKRWF